MSTPSNPTPADQQAYDAAYLASLSPSRASLFVGTFGIPGTALDAMTRLQLAIKLSAAQKIDMQIDALGWDPFLTMLNRQRSNYTVFSYIGEPNPDWETAPPGQSLPGVPPYNPTGHTGVVSLIPPPPYVVPPTPPVSTSLVGPYTGATTDELGIPGPVVGIYEPAHKNLNLPEGFEYTDPTGARFVFHIMSRPLMGAAPAVFWLGPMPAAS